jgi:hypothetical protein
LSKFFVAMNFINIRKCTNFLNLRNLNFRKTRMIESTKYKLTLKHFLNWYSGGGVQLVPLGTAATNRPTVPSPGDYDDGEIGGMTGKGNRSTRRKPVPVPFWPPQTSHAARTATRAVAVESQRLTA